MSYSYKWEVKDHRTYQILNPLAKVVLNVMYDVSCTGKENVPPSGSFILACNHLEALDPVFLAYYSGRTCHYMAKSEFFESRIKGSFLSSVNAFPVKRGRADSNALSFAAKILDSGSVLGIFPEGKRSTDGFPDVPRSGVAHLAAATHSDILPSCLFKDPYDKRSRPHIGVCFGKMIAFEELGLSEQNKPAQLHNAAKLVMNRIVGLWNEQAEAAGKENLIREIKSDS